MNSRVTVCTVLLDARKVGKMVDCSNTDDIVVHIPVELNTSTIAFVCVCLCAVLTHEGTFATSGAAAEAEEVKLVFTLASMGRAAAKEVGRHHSVRPGRIDETGGGRRSARWCSEGASDSSSSGCCSCSRGEERF